MIRVMYQVGMTNKYKILAVKPEQNRQLGRCWRRWTNHTKIDLKGMVYKDMDWFQLAALVNTPMYL
jgi:hypothetical protein